MNPVLHAFDVFSQWAIPAVMLVIVVVAAVKRVPMYESFVTGAKEGFQVAVMIIPYLVAMLFMIKVFVASGIFDDFKEVAGWMMDAVGLGDYRKTASIMMGSTETTFYILTVYFGAVNVKKIRHTLPACLIADAAGVTAAIILGYLLFHN